MFAVWIVSKKSSRRPTKKTVPLPLYFGIIICFCVANSFLPPSLLQIIYIDFAFKGTFCNLLYFSMQWCRKVKNLGVPIVKGRQDLPLPLTYPWSAKNWRGQWPPWLPRFRHHCNVWWSRGVKISRWLNLARYFQFCPILKKKILQLFKLK